MKRIAIFGLGYVGCVSAACLADAGHQVWGVDLNPDKVRMVNSGRSPIVEPGLDAMLGKVVKSGRLQATTSCEEAINNSDIAFLCVGTPGNEHGQLQLDAMQRVCEEIGLALSGSQRQFTVIIRSTVLPGTTETVIWPALIKGAGEEGRQHLKVAVNPEFLREGTALKDYAHPPMTLVGTDDQATAGLLRSIYGELDAPFVHTGVNTAEGVKYVSNAWHAVKVCFANEMGDIISRLGADQQEVMRIFRTDRKLNISEAYLRPGFAFGGSCLPKDVLALQYAAHHLDLTLPLLNSVIPSNESQIRRAIDQILNLRRKRIGVVGLSFKADTDDLRGSPLVTLVESLIGRGCNVRILDTNVSIAKLTGANRQYIIEEIPHISMLMSDSATALLEHAEVVVIGNQSVEARDVLSRLRADQVVVDLTRSMSPVQDEAREVA